MYHHSNSGRYAQVKHMKVKHLVQLVTLIVLFTWFLYQLNISHRAKVRSLKTGLEDEIGDEMLISLDNYALGDIMVDESAEVAREELIDKKSSKKSRKELRQKDRVEIEQISAEGDIVSDMFLDDSGEGVAEQRVRQEEQGRRMDREIEGIRGHSADDRKGNRSGDLSEGESDISKRQRVQNSVEADGGGVREDGRSGEKALSYLNKVIVEDVPDRFSQKTHVNGSGMVEQAAKARSVGEGTGDSGRDDVGQAQYSEPVDDAHEGSTVQMSSEGSMNSTLDAFKLMKSSSGELEGVGMNSTTRGMGDGSLDKIEGKQFRDSGEISARFSDKEGEDAKGDNGEISLHQLKAESHVEGAENEGLLAGDKPDSKPGLEASGR